MFYSVYVIYKLSLSFFFTLIYSWIIVQQSKLYLSFIFRTPRALYGMEEARFYLGWKVTRYTNANIYEQFKIFQYILRLDPCFKCMPSNYLSGFWAAGERLVFLLTILEIIILAPKQKPFLSRHCHFVTVIATLWPADPTTQHN